MFVVSVKQGFISGASPGIYVSMLNTPVTAGTPNININIPSPQYFNLGMLRIKSPVGAIQTVRVMNIWASDGNSQNITNLFSGEANAANGPIDHTFPHLLTDIKANQLIVAVNSTTATQLDIEFAGV